MGVLCGSIKVSNQRGVLTSLSVSHHKVSEDVPAKADEEEDLTEVSLYRLLNAVDLLHEFDIVVHMF